MPPDIVIPRLATIFGGVTGIKRAFDQVPSQLNTADLPAFVFIPQEATLRVAAAGGMTEEVRNYALILYVAPLALNQFGQAHTDARAYFSRVRTVWAAAITLNSLSNVDQADLISDSGVVPLVFGQAQYVGIEWTLRVFEHYVETVEA